MNRRSGDARTRTTPACPSCSGSEFYVLTRTLGNEFIELQLCRRCDAENSLVVAIDQLTEEFLRE